MNRNSRLLVVVAIAIVCATAASYAVYRALAVRPLAASGPQLVPTLVAAQPIPAGALVTKDMLRTVAWPADSRVPGSFGDPRQVLDRGAVVSIAQNEPVTESKLAAVGAGGGLPPTIPPGMRAISVRVNEVIGVAGFVVPGTRVDVVVTFEPRAAQGNEGLARVVVSNVQVLTAGTRYDQEKARQDARPIPTSVVTLLVSPEDAERIALASSEGRITLTLRNPLDTATTETTGIRMAALMGMPAPAPAVERPVLSRRPAPQVPVALPPPPPKPYTVEAIRGAKRSQEPVRTSGSEETVKE